ncbi:hypothetical protein SAMN05443270_3078 [Lacrimispora sphenoides]|uniref:hypothetical protein n=1 Tax=Lacrimispora sphenoides TaxID=29370 RepID=UPI0008C67666|nr:hypothetical protein [Lacrimispora sphenoides]SEU09275.1 hypothetical protein SAMN05443270_3078 [Lacrimispora sphenoides]
MSKLRVWWIPQIGIKETFYIPVNTPEEGKKFLDALAAYDAFQLQNNVKPDYCNVGGLQMFDESEQEWNDWCLEYYDDVDDYCESKDCQLREELTRFNQELFEQIDWNRCK